MKTTATKLLEFHNRLTDLSRLPDGWDSYKSKGSNVQTTELTRLFGTELIKSFKSWGPDIYLYPLTDGSLQIEFTIKNWLKKDIEVEIMFKADVDGFCIDLFYMNPNPDIYGVVNKDGVYYSATDLNGTFVLNDKLWRLF